MLTMDIECSRCDGTGTIGVRSSSLSYIGPGPVPDDARGVAEVKCDRCRGSGVITVDCESGDDIEAAPAWLNRKEPSLRTLNRWAAESAA